MRPKFYYIFSHIFYKTEVTEENCGLKNNLYVFRSYFFFFLFIKISFLCIKVYTFYKFFKFVYIKKFIELFHTPKFVGFHFVNETNNVNQGKLQIHVC